MKRLLRLLRHLAAWVIVKTGKVPMAIKPTCRCGRTFVVQFPDIGPLLLVSAKQPTATFMAEVSPPQSSTESHLMGTMNDMRN